MSNEPSAPLPQEGPEMYVPVKALLPLLQSWKDWVPSKSPDARVSAVNNGILQGQEWAHDDLLQVLAREDGVDVFALLKERDEYRNSALTLRQMLDGAEDEVKRLREERTANAQILKGEQHLLNSALGYLTKLHDLVREADEDFNFTGNADPDV